MLPTAAAAASAAWLPSAALASRLPLRWRPDDLLLITDYDLTLTTGDSSQCHDVLGQSERLPRALRSAFVPLLDFTKPFPPELQGGGWWDAANRALLAHGADLGARLPGVIDEARMTLRPGAADLLQRCAELSIPVLVVSAGFADVIEGVLHRHGCLTPNLRVSSNRFVFSAEEGRGGGGGDGGGGGGGGGAGRLLAVEPSPPATSLNKGETYARNAEWFSQHRQRSTVVVIGDSLSDLHAARGVPCGTLLSIGVYNDRGWAGKPPFSEYAAGFDGMLRGDTASLAPVTAMLLGGGSEGGAGAARGGVEE